MMRPETFKYRLAINLRQRHPRFGEDRALYTLHNNVGAVIADERAVHSRYGNSRVCRNELHCGGLGEMNPRASPTLYSICSRSTLNGKISGEIAEPRVVFCNQLAYQIDSVRRLANRPRPGAYSLAYPFVSLRALATDLVMNDSTDFSI